MSFVNRFESLESRSLLSANLVADIGGLYPHDSVTVASGDTYFLANDGRHHNQLWISDGSVAGTHMVKIINAKGIAAEKLVPFENGVAMLINNAGRLELWKSDGTASGTVKVANAPAAHVFETSLMSANDHLIFLTTPTATPDRDTTIWSSDGTVGDLVAIDHIGGGSILAHSGTTEYEPFAVDQRVIYCTFQPASNNGQLWSTDGTVDGTFAIGSGPEAPEGQLRPNGKILFWQYGNSQGLFSTDGTLAGTIYLTSQRPENEGPYNELSVNPAEPQTYLATPPIAGGHYYFATRARDDGSVVWESDGTVAGTHQAFTLPNSFGSVAACGDQAIIISSTPQPFDDNGTTNYRATYTISKFDPATEQLTTVYGFNTTGLVKNVVSVGNALYFFFWGDGTGNGPTYWAGMTHFTLWRTDGTTAGTVPIQDMSYWPALTPLGDNLGISSAPYTYDVKQVIEPQTPTTVQNGTQNAVSLVGGVLRVFGTDGDDNIRLYPKSDDPSRLVVALDGVLHSFPMNAISQIKIYGLDGDDHIAVLEKHFFVRGRTHIEGGNGNDTIYTGSGRDTIDGGFGDDDISAGTNGDVIDGGEGADTILCGPGDDTATGGDGVDSIQGNAGNDQLSGGDDPSRDHLEGDDGHDVLFGSAAFDVFFNGSGTLDPLDTILTDA